jgi:hypothetical protein
MNFKQSALLTAGAVLAASLISNAAWSIQAASSKKMGYRRDPPKPQARPLSHHPAGMMEHQAKSTKQIIATIPILR